MDDRHVADLVIRLDERVEGFKKALEDHNEGVMKELKDIREERLKPLEEDVEGLKEHKTRTKTVGSIVVILLTAVGLKQLADLFT